MTTMSHKKSVIHYDVHVVFNDATGRPTDEIWRRRGHGRALDRIGGPALTMWHDNGQLWVQAWLVEGIPHRDDGPSKLRYSESGKLLEEEYFIHGVIHRAGDLPARTYTE